MVHPYSRLTLHDARHLTPDAPTSIESFLNDQIETYFTAHDGSLPAPGLYDRLLVQVEKPLIQQTLRATGGNQIKAAEILGLNRNTLRKKMRLLGLDARVLRGAKRR